MPGVNVSRPGIYGRAIDGSSGRELDRVGSVFGVAREPARLWRWRLPWRQTDEAYRRRIAAVAFGSELWDTCVRR